MGAKDHQGDAVVILRRGQLLHALVASQAGRGADRFTLRGLDDNVVSRLESSDLLSRDERDSLTRRVRWHLWPEVADAAPGLPVLKMNGDSPRAWLRAEVRPLIVASFEDNHDGNAD